MKNITRYTYEDTAFKGWRVCITKHGYRFEKYFSDKKHGGKVKAQKAAITYKKAVRDILDNAQLANKDIPVKILTQIRDL